MSQENKDTVREIFARNDAAGNMSPSLEFMADDYRVHLPGMPPLDVNGFAGFGNAFYSACPGMTHELLDTIGEGDFVTTRLRITGKQTQSFVMPTGTIPPTNADLSIDAMNMFRFSGGKVAEQWVIFDMLGVMQSLGVIPAN